MADENKSESKEVSKDTKNMTVNEVIRENKKGNLIDTATDATTFEERAKVEKTVEMVKIGRDPSGNWEWARSDRMTKEHHARRTDMLEKIKMGKKV